jgi:riboflavin kinase/FMN adenylyltransferase
LNPDHFDAPMQHYWNLEDVSIHNAWVTIGSFDGVHLGHQAILHALAEGAHAAGDPAVVVTFYPHPSVVLRNRASHRYLTTPDERADLLGRLGVDVVITYPFTLQAAQLTALEFMTQLSSHLRLRELWVGHDFALGRGREGNEVVLQQIGDELGYNLHQINPIQLDGVVISSSAIRTALTDGDVEKASRLLGRPYRVNGKVIPGDGRGRTIGIPTANLEIWPERALPKSGVYAARAEVAGRSLAAVANVGYRPTFETQAVEPRLEAHLLDFHSDLYGQDLNLEFIARLRDEQRFSGAEALVEQIQRDIVAGREILKEMVVAQQDDALDS